ncbi:MAG: hypothetical protein M3136_02120 [Thermoproteota archaeon]|nr:hypothetical protein [Thermoproteota archaeon]
MKTFLTVTSGSVRVPLVLTMAIFVLGNIPVMNAQVLSNQPVTPPERENTFQSITDSFSITIPDGWVLQDVYNTDTYTLLDEMMQGSRLLAQLCPEEQAVADIEGTHRCEESNESVYIQRYPNLADEPEFASIINSNITNEDLLDYHMVKLQKLGYGEINILQKSNLTINVTDTEINKTIAIVPANLIEMRYNNANSSDMIGYFMLAATNVTSNVGIISGYSLSYEADAATFPSGRPPELIQWIFQSFEFLKKAREGELATQDDEDNEDYNNYAVPSKGGPTQYPENLLFPSVGPPDQTNANTSNSRSLQQ